MWNNLTMNQRAEVIKMAVKSGIYKLDDIRNAYNKFAEGGPEETYTPSPNEPDKIKWFEHWYNNREKQLANNYRESDYYISAGDVIRKLLPNSITDSYFAQKAKNHLLQNINLVSEGVLPTTRGQGNLTESQYKIAQRDLKDSVSDLTPEDYDKVYYLNALMHGTYYPGYKTILYSSDVKAPTIIHERTHASDPKFIENYIGNNSKTKHKEGIEKDYYLDSANEVYGRLNQFRYKNNLDPTEIITPEKLEYLKKNAKDYNLLNRYDDDTLLFLFNDVAYNPIEQQDTPNITAYGGPLVQLANRYAMGGPEDDLVDRVIQEEGFLAKPTNIGDGKMTLGSGLTASKWHKLYNQKGEWTEEDNRKAVLEELETRRRWAEKDIPNWDKLPEESQNALLSYKYNFDFNRNNSPKLYKALSEGDYEEAARQIDATSKNPKFRKGLQDRRQRERDLFMKGIDSMRTLEPEVIDSMPIEEMVYTPPQSVLDNISKNNGRYLITGYPPLAGVRSPSTLLQKVSTSNIYNWLRRMSLFK